MFNRFDLDVFHPLTHKIIVIVFVIKIKYDDLIQYTGIRFHIGSL